MPLIIALNTLWCNLYVVSTSLKIREAEKILLTTCKCSTFLIEKYLFYFTSFSNLHGKWQKVDYHIHCVCIYTHINLTGIHIWNLNCMTLALEIVEEWTMILIWRITSIHSSALYPVMLSCLKIFYHWIASVKSFVMDVLYIQVIMWSYNPDTHYEISQKSAKELPK